MNMGVENGDFNGGHWYMNIPTISEAKNHNSIYSTNKRDQIAPNRSEMENTGLQFGVDVYVMLPVSTLNQYYSMEYNN